MCRGAWQGPHPPTAAIDSVVVRCRRFFVAVRLRCRGGRPPRGGAGSVAKMQKPCLRLSCKRADFEAVPCAGAARCRALAGSTRKTVESPSCSPLACAPAACVAARAGCVAVFCRVVARAPRPWRPLAALPWRCAVSRVPASLAPCPVRPRRPCPGRLWPSCLPCWGRCGWKFSRLQDVLAFQVCPRGVRRPWLRFKCIFRYKKFRRLSAFRRICPYFIQIKSTASSGSRAIYQREAARMHHAPNERKRKAKGSLKGSDFNASR